VLGDRNAQAVGIDFLKSVGADHRPRHLAGDRHQRDRIELGVGHRRQQIGRAGAGRRHADRRHTGRTCHSLRHEAAALLVPGKDVMDLRRLREGVVDRQDGAAGNAGQCTNALSFEQTHNDLCAGEGFGGLLGQGTLLKRRWRLALPGGRPEKENPRSACTGGGLWNLLSFVLRFDLSSSDPRRCVRSYAYHAYHAYQGKHRSRTEAWRMQHGKSGSIQVVAAGHRRQGEVENG
jgi:hypothetical protein